MKPHTRASPGSLLELILPLGELDDCLFIAPELYTSDTLLNNSSATERVFVYCLGMTVYSAAEFGCEQVSPAFVDGPCKLVERVWLILKKKQRK